MIMYQIETVAVPILDQNENAESYIQLKIDKPYITLDAETYIKNRYKYYCKELFVVKCKTRNSCASAIYFKLDP